jgi:carbamoyltransferase
MKIIGINCFGHDSAATLIIDGKVVFAVEEERLLRKKHYGGIPFKSIEACLDYANLKYQDLDHVAYYFKPLISYLHMPVYLFKYWRKVPTLIKESKNYTMEENLGWLNYLGQMKRLPSILAKYFHADVKKIKFHYLEHHLCHAASAFYPSPFKEAAILTIDGAGEWTTSMLCFGSGNNIKKISEVGTPYSLGAFYQAISVHLGFTRGEGPGKLMGLASYGNRNTDIYKAMRKIFTLNSDGTFLMDMSYFSYHYTRSSAVTKKFNDLFGPSKVSAFDWSKHELDVAAAAQQVIEEVILHMVRVLKEKTGADYLCMAGGVALNSVTNGLIAKSGLFKDIFIQPAASDSGTTLGGALLVNHLILNQPRNYVMESAFLGNEYDSDSYETAIKEYNLPYVRSQKSLKFAAKKLAQGNIVGWFQGRMEFGPRALGNRSILGSPTISDMKDILNRRVKFREPFRPFAAIVAEEDCGKYFDSAFPNPYMLFVYKVKEEYLGRLPAITHIDNTVRIQTVTRLQNPKFYELLENFKLETGYSVLVNTSFNIKGEPIVCSPQDAVKSFVSADMDYLIMGEYVISKPHNHIDLDTIETL